MTVEVEHQGSCHSQNSRGQEEGVKSGWDALPSAPWLQEGLKEEGNSKRLAQNYSDGKEREYHKTW